VIKAIIYDKTANTQTGQMGGRMRVVGYHYDIPGQKPGDDPLLETIVPDMSRDQKVLVLTYDNGMQQMLPDRGVEKILKFE